MSKDRQISINSHFIHDRAVGTVIVFREPSDNEVCETIPWEVLQATEFQRFEAWKESRLDAFDGHQFLKQLVYHDSFVFVTPITKIFEF